MKKNFIFSFLYFFGCAAIGPPTGGPEDKIPPKLLLINPISGTTNISDNFPLSLLFSERIIDNITSSSIRLLPQEKNPLKIKVNKNNIEIVFPDSLKENQTYQLIITREILDERKNKLDKTYQLAFSTGDSISKGEISGKIFNLKNKSTYVYLYNNFVSKDSLYLKNPDFFTEPDDSGRYSFKFLDHGEYKIVAHQGVLPASKINLKTSRYGLYNSSEIILDSISNIISEINMKLTEPLDPFRVLTISMKDKRIGIITFSNGFNFFDQRKKPKINFYNEDKEYLKKSPFYFQDSISNILNFYISDIDLDRNYFIEVVNLNDTTNQIIESTLNKLNFNNSERIIPEIVLKNKNKTDLRDGFKTIDFIFNQPIMLQEKPDSIIKIFSNLTQLTNFNVIHEKQNLIKIINKNEKIDFDKINVKILNYKIKSLDSLSMKDSITSIDYNILKKKKVGSITGEIKNSKSKNNYVIASMLHDKKNNFKVKSNPLDDKFEILNLSEGFWNIYAFEDLDNNGKYNYGDLFPFVPSERFVNFPHVIEVRSNWENSGNIILFP